MIAIFLELSVKINYLLHESLDFVHIVISELIPRSLLYCNRSDRMKKFGDGVRNMYTEKYNNRWRRDPRRSQTIESGARERRNIYEEDNLATASGKFARRNLLFILLFNIEDKIDEEIKQLRREHVNGEIHSNMNIERQLQENMHGEIYSNTKIQRNPFR